MGKAIIALIEIVSIVAAVFRKWRARKKKQEQDDEERRIRNNPNDAWRDRFGSVHDNQYRASGDTKLPAADTGTAGSGRRWDGEPGPE